MSRVSRTPSPRLGVATAAALFVLALIPRLYGALTFGFGLDGPGTYRTIDFDEGNSCRAYLRSFPYPTFVGGQVVAIANALGNVQPFAASGAGLSRPQDANSDYRREARVAKEYCESAPLVMIGRIYSVVAGAASAVLIAMLGARMWPGRREIAATAGLLLAFSQLHVAESHFATLDAAQVFFTLLATVVLAGGIVERRPWQVAASVPISAAAIAVKYFVFAPLAYVGFVPARMWHGRSLWKVVGLFCLLGVALAFLLGREKSIAIVSQADYVLWGNPKSIFGTGYGNIGTWRRWIRNSTNLCSVPATALGMPAYAAGLYGVRRSLSDRERSGLWWLQLPAAAYALYMLLLGPVTYYRNYLPLLPPIVLLAAYGFWASPLARKKWVVGAFLLYPLLMTCDSEYNYANDPRRALREWDRAHAGTSALYSFYVVPPNAAAVAYRPFDLGAYLRFGARYLEHADYVILSENWYDTAYPNELNGPIAWNPEWLIKTRPEFALAFRKIIAGDDSNLQLETEWRLTHFTPELMLHQRVYGSFPLFVGDLEIYRVIRGADS